VADQINSTVIKNAKQMKVSIFIEKNQKGRTKFNIYVKNIKFL